MIHLLFNTLEHTLEVNFTDYGTDSFENVTTIKTHSKDGYYEVLQKQETKDTNAPLFRFPITNTVIQYVHE